MCRKLKENKYDTDSIMSYVAKSLNSAAMKFLPNV